MARSILLDTNLLVLLAVGETGKSLIAKHKRTGSYEIADFEWLQARIRASRGLLLSPNILAETSNLIRQTDRVTGARISETLKAIIGSFPESYRESRTAVEDAVYSRLGLTDAVMLLLVQTGALLITDDLDLALAAQKIDPSAINYNHIRAARLDRY